MTLRRRLGAWARALYRRAPLSLDSKMRLKSAAFQLAPLFFRHTRAYRDWVAFEGRDARLPARSVAAKGSPRSVVANAPAPQALPSRSLNRPQHEGTSSDVDAVVRLAVVSHDAHPHGAQHLALNLAFALSESACEVEVILLGDGVLRPRFESVAPVHFLGDVSPTSAVAISVARSLATRGITAAICNTTASGAFLAVLADAGIRCIALIHELPGEIRRLHLQEDARLIAQWAERVVFPSQTVIDGFRHFATVDPRRCLTRPQGLYKRNRLLEAPSRQAARRRLRAFHGWDAATQIVLAVGQASLRKGADLFVEMAAAALERRPDIRFLWIGDVPASMREQLDARMAGLVLGPRVAFAGAREDTDEAFAAADIFALPSREDPFPSVVLEAMQAGLPVVGFEGAGGFVDLLRAGCGKTVPAYDAAAMAHAIVQLLDDPALCQRVATLQQTRIESDYCFRRYAEDLRELAISVAAIPLREDGPISVAESPR